MNIREELAQLKEENKHLKSLLKIQEDASETSQSIENLIDIKKLEEIFMKFSKLTGYTTGFVKQDTREVLVSTGWTDICKIYHRGNDSSAHICQNSNAELTKNLKETHQVSLKECQHGMVDGATPIIIGGKHLADLFSGQVLFNQPDIKNFKLGAQEFGYDMTKYLKALEDVKITSKDKLEEVLEFLSVITQVIAEIGRDKKEFLKLNASLERKVEERVKESESLLTLFDESDNVLFKWNNDKEWSVAFVSKSVSKLLGYTKEDFENNKISYASCIHPDDIEMVSKEVLNSVNSDNNFFSHNPYRITTKDGKIKWILDRTVVVKDTNSKVTHYLGYLSDITELKNYQNRLEELSKTDQLTKVRNRLYIDESLQKQYYRFFRNDEKCSLILIDIDLFKDINDNFGHIIGDLFLVEFSTILKENIRESDTVGRWGGEEFLIILPHTDQNEAKNVAHILKNIISNFKFSKVGHRTASFGISEFQTGLNSEQVLDNADKALYQSKNKGRNQITCFDCKE